MGKAIKAVILARVSSNEQEYGKSLQAQVEQGHRYAEHNGLEVIKTYEIIESSTRGKRTKFNEMLEFVSKQKEPIAIIVHTVDRLQRRFNESLELDPRVRKGEIELHFVANGLILTEDSPESFFMMWDYNVIGAKSYISQLKENTKRGLNKKIEDGEWPTRAPLGYLNYTEGKYRRIKVDEERAPKIQKMFEELSTGLYSVDEVGRRAIQNGLTTRNGGPISRNAVHKIINNPFYYGIMKTKKGMQPHIYQPLIDKTLFEQCQKVKNRKFKGSVAKQEKHNHIFKGLLRCGVCGHLISSYTKVKKSGKTYTYLRCACHALNAKCSNPQITEKEALEMVEKNFEQLNISNKDANDIQKHLIIFNRQQAKEQIQAATVAKKGLENIEKQIDSLIDLRLQNSLPEDLFQTKLQKLQNQKSLYEKKLADTNLDADSFNVSLEEVFDLAQNAGKLFESSQINEKREILSCIFANLQLKDKNLYFLYKKPFDLLVKGSICNQIYPMGNNLRPLLSEIEQTASYIKKIKQIWAIRKRAEQEISITAGN